MKVCGTVAEYNPFHNGHKYHLEKSRRETGADCMAVVMSSSFVQRGEAAVFSKHARAEAAVRNGADIVFELPAYFSLMSAGGFARGGVELLNMAGIGFLSFGAECTDLDKLSQAAALVLNEPPALKEAIRQNLKSGLSYANARSDALRKVGYGEYADILSCPNNILACEYLNALRNYKIRPVSVKRRVAHDAPVPCKDNASASYLRNKLKEGGDISSFVPFVINEKPLFTEDLEDLILYSLSVTSPDVILKIPDCSDGLGERLLSARYTSLDSLLDFVKTKRFAMSRIKRVLMNILIHNTLPQNLSPSYLRVLAFNGRGAEYLKKIKNTARVPIVIKPASYKANDPIWKLEMRASEIRAIKSEIKKEDVRTSPIAIL